MTKVYGKFCSRHNEAVSLYKELHAKDKRFQAFVKVRAALCTCSTSEDLTCTVWDLCMTSVSLCAENNEQQCCAAAQHPRVHFVGDSEDHQISCSDPEDPSAHQR